MYMRIAIARNAIRSGEMNLSHRLASPHAQVSTKRVQLGETLTNPGIVLGHVEEHVVWESDVHSFDDNTAI